MAAATSFLATWHYYVGPAGGLLAVLGAVAACRWVFSTSHRERRAAAEHPDFGLLVPVAEPADRGEAERQRRVLAGAGLRATVAAVTLPREPVRVSADGHVVAAPPPVPVLRLLVFPADRARARMLLRR